MATKLFLVRAGLNMASIWFAWRAGVAAGAAVASPGTWARGAMRRPFLRNAAASIGLLVASWFF